MLNSDIIKGKWKEIKGEIQRAWGDLTDDELDRTQGDLTSIGGLIQNKYGHKKEEVSDKLNSIFGRFDAPVDRGPEQNTRPFSSPLDAVKDHLRRQ